MSQFDEQTDVKDKPKFGQTVIDDFRRGDFQVTLKRDWQDVIQFYLDDDDFAKLDEMGSFKKWLFSTWWLLKGMFFKLTPARRIILLISIVLFIDGIDTASGTLGLSFLGLILILILELKDKLLAQDELQSGRAVQLALMPDRSPLFEGWDIWLYTEPANDVGGDLVDYLHVGPDRLGVALGDVAGKGLPAALFMAKLQATIRAVAPTHDTLPALVGEINQIFWRDKLPNRFASLLYAELDAGGNAVRFVNAGHMPPALVRDGEVDVCPRDGNTAIGLVRGAEFSEQDLELRDGDAVVFYSDGVTEARDTNGDFFGDHRLASLLERIGDHSARSIGTAVVRAVERFSQGERPADDLSVIVIKRAFDAGAVSADRLINTKTPT